ncbi:uncharacterized protein MELLADRAFT_95197 [Melampsora larici-populina 98AG31]|uniref:Uncharacterized protein n=1 Tax=Melampsora larici-populina (strain 98AG31 / pathotype 3-4-7) TaxID=747676 RepID=F4RCH2_MELLP|nr:uncharacterized protein MELLADRAFT_95197 [Melampsora larici-populina 98AG31]EGG09732.1 hypothetical protein MELLADRAFT_95197 [Melampsora larici-populina 98AG31]
MGHLEIWLPALTWVNSDIMKDLGALEWKFDNRPTDFLCHIMPRFPAQPPPKGTPYACRTTQTTLVGVNNSPRVASTPRVASNPRPAQTSSRPGSGSGTPGQAKSWGPKSYVIQDEPDENEFAGKNVLRANRHRSDVYLYFDVSPASVQCLGGYAYVLDGGN